MTNNERRRVIILAAGLSSLCAVAQAAPADSRFTVVIQVNNAAAVPTRILTGAQDDASRIYRHAGLMLVWVSGRINPGCDAGPIVRIVLLSLSGADRYVSVEQVSTNALGIANEAASHVHVFWERVTTSALRTGRDSAGLLGVVLAHEIGHVLLPGEGHSAVGIMRGSVVPSISGPLRFTDEQADAMRRRLRERESIRAGCDVASDANESRRTMEGLLLLK